MMKRGDEKDDKTDSETEDGLEPIVLLTTGGTIDKVYFDARSDFEVGESMVGELLSQANVREPFVVHGLMRKDSLDLTDADRALIRTSVNDAAEQRIIITHGTDTMTDTAQALFPQSTRTVVLTGSLAPARFAQSDAVFNVGMAFAAVQSLPAGVYIVMNGQVFDAARVEKDLAQNVFVRR
jgi:L-asparaginase